MIKEEGRGYTV